MFASRLALVALISFAVQANPTKGVGCGGDTDVLLELQDTATTCRAFEKLRAAMIAGHKTRFNFHMRHNDPQAVLLRLDSEREPVLNKRNLDAIKVFLLKKGQRCTYSQKFSNNPCFTTDHFIFYLNPDPGGPYQHPQWNMNCDPNEGDFNTLVVRRRMLDDRDDGRDQYAYIGFINADDIRVAPAFGDHPPALQLHALAVNAVRELRAARAVDGVSLR